MSVHCQALYTHITVWQAHIPNCKCIFYLCTASVKSWRSRWLGHTKWRHVTALDFKSRWNWCGKLRLKRQLTWRQENKQIWIQAVINIKWGRRKNYKSHFLCNVNFLWLQNLRVTFFSHGAAVVVAAAAAVMWQLKNQTNLPQLPAALMLHATSRLFSALCRQSVRQTDRQRDRSA